jgi:hypothetical protein
MVLERVTSILWPQLPANPASWKCAWGHLGSPYRDRYVRKSVFSRPSTTAGKDHGSRHSDDKENHRAQARATKSPQQRSLQVNFGLSRPPVCAVSVHTLQAGTPLCSRGTPYVCSAQGIQYYTRPRTGDHQHSRSPSCGARIGRAPCQSLGCSHTPAVSNHPVGT